MGDYTAIAGLILSILTMGGTFTAWIAKLGGRVNDLEAKVRNLEAKEQTIISDINSIKISLAEIKIMLGVLVKADEKRNMD